MKKTKTKKTTSGSRRSLLLLTLLLAAVSFLSAKDKKKRPEPADSYAVIAGTIFRSEGFALGGAEVSVSESPGTGATDNSKHLKTLKATTNDRGEFAVRVPAVPAKYRIDVKMRGFEPQAKDVSIEGEQRKELNFLLEAAK